ncbi:hypothetical protein [Streptomyces sp. NPDC088785]|uniref:hypothetical protein n=1 Tax=Streptomyces sp. NPDC088785 TaxID=3365897 RepID=UPI0038042002
MPSAADLQRNLMSVDLSFFRSQTAQNLRAEGRSEGWTEGLAEGRTEGLAEGRAEGEVKAILRILDRRGITVPDDARATITSCTDPDTLDRWLDCAITATTIDDVLAEPAQPDSPSA